MLRSWFERNKHIFPASRWEPYDPEKKWDKYTVSQSESILTQKVCESDSKNVQLAEEKRGQKLDSVGVIHKMAISNGAPQVYFIFGVGS